MMEDTHITITGDPMSVEGKSCTSLRSRGDPQRRRGSLASVTLTLGAATIILVGAIGFLSLVFATSRAASQSQSGKVLTSQNDDQLEALHIEKREVRTEASAQQGSCSEELCLTKECVHAASNLLKFMDDTVDPCDDFYRYACGGWMRDNEHQLATENIVYSFVFDVLSENVDATLEELLRTGGDVPEELLDTKPYQDLFFFYERCREVEPGTQDMSPAHDALRALDQFQVGKPFDSSTWDLTRALLQLLQINGAPLFDIVVDSDVKEMGKFSIVISSPRKFGLVSHLVRNPLHRRSHRSLHKFVRERGRRMLFGDKGEEAVRETLTRGVPVLRAGGRDTLTHALQRDAVGNLVSAGDLKEEEKEATTTTSSSSSSSSSSTLHTTPSTTSHSTSQVTTTNASTDEPSTSITATATTTSTTTTTSNTTAEEEEVWIPFESVSRRIVYRLFQEGMDEKRLESVASIMHEVFPNASVLSSSSSSSTDGEVPDDVYSEVMIHFLPMLQKLLPSQREELEIQQSGKQYNHFTISALQQLCPVIDWSVLLGGLLNMTITEEHNIYIHYPDHLAKLCSLLDNTEPWVIHYALLTLYSHDVLQETVYATEGMDRMEFCLMAVKSVFGEVMSNLYLHHIGNETLEKIEHSASSIMEVLREEVEESVSEAAWLGQEDKDRVMRKLHAMKLKVGARERHWDISFVNKSHAELNFPPNASFLHTVLELYRTFRHQLYQLHHAPMESDDFIWSFTVQPYVVDAFYAVDINTIVFPEAFFHPPYHRHRAPHYMNFGSTATSIAHEIFHALDFLGIQFDEKGLLTRPFSEAMVEKLNTTSDCYHDLLNDSFFEFRYLHHTLIALEIDNSITKNENLADISGIRAAFRSYRRWEERQGEEPRLPALPLSPHQLFFVSAAQPYCSVTSMFAKILLMELDEHLPNKLRINGMMKNLPEFTQVFGCSPTSKMFSESSCHLF